MTIANLDSDLRWTQGSIWSLAAIAGAALQLQQPDLWSVAAYGQCLAVCLMAVAACFGGVRALGRRRHFSRRWSAPGWCLVQIVLAFSFAGAAFALVGLRACVFDTDRLDPALEGCDVQVVGLVRDLTQNTASGLRFRLQVESAQLDGQPVKLPPRIDVGWYRGLAPRGAGSELSDWELQRQPQDLVPGQRWRFTLRVKAPHGSRNPNGFDYELWLWTQGVQATAYVRAGPRDAPPQLLADTWAYPLASLRQFVRGRILSQVSDPQSAGLIAALVVGDQAAIERSDWDVFRATGVAHLVSISGLHITMFAWGALWLIGGLWRRSQRLCLWLPAPTAALLGGMLLALAYSLFSGWGVPAQRTCVMLACVGLLRISGLRWPWPQVWLFAFVAVVVSDPWSLLQAGFWLSFVAVGVLFASDPGGQASPPVKRQPRSRTASDVDPRDDLDTVALPEPAQATHWSRRYGRDWMLRLGQGAQSLVREQWTITLALAPLTLFLFGQVSLVGLLANMLAVPWVTLVLTPLAMVGVVFPWVLDGAAFAGQALMAVLQAMAQWPAAVVQWAVPPLWLAAVATFGGLMLVAPGPWSLRLLGLPLLLAVPLWQAPAPANGTFELLAADIGQGNAVLVRTSYHSLLYDTGPRYSLESDAGHRVLVPLLQSQHIHLDRVMLSHRDTDHVGGAAAVLATQPQADVWSSLSVDHPLLAGRTSQRCEAGQTWDWDGVHFQVLHPRAQDYDVQPPPKPNALSCVLRIDAGGQSTLLVGDIERAQEAALRERQGDALRSTVLLAPHHGSKTSSSPEFLATVQPELVLIQAGYRNRYGHPAAEVVARYQALGWTYGEGRRLEMVDTPHCGAFSWQSKLPHNGACARETGRHYWHHRLP
jgi:competence protein ComEC